MKLPKELSERLVRDSGIAPEHIRGYIEVVNTTIQMYSRITIRRGELPTLQGLMEFMDDMKESLIPNA